MHSQTTFKLVGGINIGKGDEFIPSHSSMSLNSIMDMHDDCNIHNGLLPMSCHCQQKESFTQWISSIGYVKQSMKLLCALAPSWTSSPVSSSTSGQHNHHSTSSISSQTAPSTSLLSSLLAGYQRGTVPVSSYKRASTVISTRIVPLNYELCFFTSVFVTAYCFHAATTSKHFIWQLVCMKIRHIMPSIQPRCGFKIRSGQMRHQSTKDRIY